jgi:hypothetical protein
MPDGTQKIEDTGPLTKKAHGTVDEEVTRAALAFIDKAHSDGKPFFVWWNSTRMHIFTHLKPASEGKKGAGEWPRKEFIYWTDDGNVAALRYTNWKITFLEQKAEGMRVWQQPVR